jgi:hypothetical protein
MKRRFILEPSSALKGEVAIIGQRPESHPYLRIGIGPKNCGETMVFWIQDKDLKILAQNILRALK